MQQVKVNQLIEQADALANEMIDWASRRGIHAYDFLLITALAERLVQDVVAPGAPGVAVQAIQESQALYTAVTTRPDQN